MVVREKNGVVKCGDGVRKAVVVMIEASIIINKTAWDGHVA